MKRWKNVVNLARLAFRTTSSRRHYRTAEVPLAKRMGARKLGFHAESLAPGQFSCPYHFHHGEEELFYVLSGSATLRQADRFREVGPGDLIFFETGPAGAHQFWNHGEEPFTFLALSTNEPLEVCEYPDSDKVLVAAARAVHDRSRKVDYWKGEADPRPRWPGQILARRRRE